MRGPRLGTATAVGLAIVAAVAIGACGPLGTSGGGGGDAGMAAPEPTGTAPPPDGHDSGAAVDSAPAAPGFDAALPASDASAGGGYTVTGPTVFDAAHHPHWFHGVDRPSLEWSSTGEQLSPQDYKNMASWKANVVRIALNQDFWLSDAPSYDAAYPPLIDMQIQWAEAAGLDVILDLHWSDRGDYGQKAAQQRMADAHSVTFWTEVAGRYKTDGRVLFELYNEPHDVSWDVWQNGGASGDGFTVSGMQQLYAAVRATGAENLVLIGGLGFAFDLSGVPAHRIAGHNIVWATHPYNQTSKQPSNWDSGFGSLAATDPVMATEFGDTGPSCGTDYVSAFIAYADAHKISWSAWAWYVSGCTFPSIVTDWTGHPNAAGQIEKTALGAY